MKNKRYGGRGLELRRGEVEECGSGRQSCAAVREARREIVWDRRTGSAIN